MLVDLRTKFPELTGKLAEKCLVAADITTNKNMVPFDSRSPFQTSGLRFGTPAITTRGLKEDKMDYIVGLKMCIRDSRCIHPSKYSLSRNMAYSFGRFLRRTERSFSTRRISVRE